MAYSKVQIANMALFRLGQAQTIAALTEDSTAAQLLNAAYEPAAREVLRDVRPTIAQRTVALALIQEDPNDEWGYEYRWPLNCLTPLRIVDGDRTMATPVPFAVAGDASGKVIWTDEEDAVLLYVIDLATDPTHYPSELASALAWKLAAEVGLALSREPALAQRAEQKYHKALSIARAAQANEEVADAPSDASWIRDR